MSETTTPPVPENAAPAKSQKSELLDFLQFLVKLALFVGILRSFIFAPFSIPSESMLPRLLIGDYLVVKKWSYGYSKHSLPFSMPLIPGRVFTSMPERGDIVVFKKPPENNVDYIKRVIGLPGDFVQMREGVLYLNDVAIPKKRIADFVVPVTPNMGFDPATGNPKSPCTPAADMVQASDGTMACHYPRYQETLPSGKTYEVLDTDPAGANDNTEVFHVPEGHLFMMGDNRDNSSDSRVSVTTGGVEMVPVENLVGKAWFMAFSTDGSASWFLPWTWFTAARGSRIGGGF